MTHLILLGAVFALCAFIYFLHRFNTAWPMPHDGRRTRSAVLPAHHHPRHPAGAVARPLSWHGAARVALICALLLVALAARLWIA